MQSITCRTSKLAVIYVKVIKTAASFLASKAPESYLHSGFFYYSSNKKPH